jgi:hypothetical protein
MCNRYGGLQTRFLLSGDEKRFYTILEWNPDYPAVSMPLSKVQSKKEAYINKMESCGLYYLAQDREH